MLPEISKPGIAGRTSASGFKRNRAQGQETKPIGSPPPHSTAAVVSRGGLHAGTARAASYSTIPRLHPAGLLRIDVPPTLLARADEVIPADDSHAHSKLRAKSKRGGRMRRRAEFARGSQSHSRLPASGTSIHSFKLQTLK
jgi:hypothetical protein